MDLAGKTFVGKIVRLEPLHPKHASDLAVAGNPDMFKYTYGPTTWTTQGLQDYIKEMLELPGWVCYTLVALDTEKCIGVTCFLDIREDHKRVEIGSTWISPHYQGKHANTESKYLLLHHFFDTLAGHRVQIKTDPRNLRSVGAIEKVGFVREGLLRRHMILDDGTVRDSAMYSMIDLEWPEKRIHLEEMLGYQLPR